MKKYLTIGGLLLGVFVLVGILYWADSFGVVNEKLTDRLYLKHEPKANVVIVAIDDQSIAKIGAWPWSRETFAKLLPYIKGAKAVGFDITFSEASPSGQADDATFLREIKSLSSPVVFPLQLRGDGEVAVKPASIFLPAVKLGYVNVPLGADGVGRKMIRETGDLKSFSSVLEGEASSPREYRISYAGPAKTFLTLPFIDVQEGKVPARIFDGAIVLVGATANDLHDFIDTPFGFMPGIEVHANAIETLESGHFLVELPSVIALLVLFLLTIVSGVSVVFFKHLGKLIAVLVGILVFIVLIGMLSFHYGLILPTFYILLDFVLASAIALVYQYITESKEKQFIRKTFQYYLMPEVIHEIMQNPGKLVLGGEKKRLTILFSDIRGFTSLSEKLTPEALVQNINEYFTLMSDNIMENRGLVDKYIGDAIMAFWGAPVSNEHQACDACLAALSMSRSLKALNEKWKASGVPEIGIGIGLNTGDVIVGNMGSEKRFNYTIMGDEVNFGSRLEGLNKAYGTECIISEETKDAVEHDSQFVIRELDNVMVKGKKEPKLIYELVTREADESFKKILAFFAEGLEHYKKGDFKEALSKFNAAVEIGSDGPSQAFIERCEYLINHPPEEWNGVYEFKTK